MKDKRLRRPEFWLPPATLFAVAFIVYWQTFGFPWIYDDIPVIVNNPDVRSIQGFLANSYPGRPLRELSFLLDHALFGLNPAGWHIQQILWHATCAWLVFVLGCRLGLSRPVAWVGAGLFVLHPAQVEVVANLSHRKDLLALAFSLMAALAYLKGLKPGARAAYWIVAAWLLAFIAFLAKQNALVLPLVFLAAENFLVPAEHRFMLRYKKTVGVVLGSACLGALGWFVFGGGLELYRESMGPLLVKMNYLREASGSVYFALVLKSLAFMTLQWAWPAALAPEYTYAVPGSWADPWVIGSLLGLCFYGVLLGCCWRRLPAVAFCLVWLGLFWLPVSNLWPLAYFAADRYLYAPAVGACLLSALALNHLLCRRKTGLLALGTGVMLVLAALTWQQSRVWASPQALWSQAVKVSPESTWALNNLGSAYLLQGQPQLALPLVQKAAKNFNDSKTLYNLGLIYEKLGEFQTARRYYLSFLAMNDPRYRSEIMTLRRRFGLRVE